MRPILVCGLDTVLPKIARHYKLLGEITGAQVVICSRDVIGFSEQVADRFDLKVKFVSKSSFASMREFVSLLLRLRPAHVEIYHDMGSDWSHLLRVLAARLLRVPIVMVCRGGELRNWEIHTLRRKIFYKFSLRQATLVIYKQLHMPSELKALNVREDRCLFFHNRIPYVKRTVASTNERRGVLFLNSFQPFRYPETAFRVAVCLSEKYPDVDFIIGGFRSRWEEKRIKPLYDGLSDKNVKARIQVLPFSEGTDRLMEKCCIFLLPSELVFLNYTLLEAMESGLVPVISNAEGAEKIVDHGKDGMIVELNETAFIETVDYLLSQPELMERMAQAARRKIHDHFNLEPGLKELVHVYEEKVWTNAQTRT